MNAEIETTPIDVSNLSPCLMCARPPAHGNTLVFYEVRLSQCVVDIGAAQRLAGMEMMMGGAAGIARALSPDTAVARRIEPPVRRFLCLECATRAELAGRLIGEFK